MSFRSVAFIFSAAALTQLASAQVTDYGVFQTEGYQQTGAASSMLQGFYASERVDTANSGDIADAEVTRPNGTMDTLSVNGSGTNWSYQSSTYNTRTQFLTAWGTDNGTSGYYFQADAMSIFNYLSVPNIMWAPNPALVTNWSALQSYNASQSLTVNFTGFTEDPNANANVTFVEIYDTSTGNPLQGNSGTGETSYTIAANSLVAGHQYTFAIFDSNRLIYNPDQLFEGATPFESWDVVTSVNFTTQAVPEPTPLAFLGLGAGALLIRRRRR